jgi:hypothetical protein
MMTRAYPPLGYAIEGWHVEKRLGTNAHGESVFEVRCLGCGRKLPSTEAQLRSLKPCTWCATANDTSADTPTRLSVDVGPGWRQLP